MKQTVVSIDSLSVDKSIIDFIKNEKDINIDKYSGKGSNGELFFGTHRILEKRVALKFYYIDSEGFAHREAQILANIRNPNILNVDDAKEVSKEYAYFLTPEIEGGDLDKYIKNREINIFQSIHIIKGVLNGLTALHAKPNLLVHRDLKPANILITRNGTPIIADFGSIQVVPKNKTYVKASRHSFIYSPPEAIKSDKYYFQSDIYQVGILLYQLLGGYFPYLDIAWLSERNRKQYLRIKDDYLRTKYFNKIVGDKICNGTLLRLNTLPKYITRKLRSIIKKATNVDIRIRYKTTSAVMKDIHDYFATAVNWCSNKEDYIAIKQDHFKLRIVKKDKNNYMVRRKCKDNKWRAYNKINGSLHEIFDKINSA